MNNSTQAIGQLYPAIYLAFRDPGFHWGLFLPALFCLILAMIGIPLNASVCWVTIKHRSTLRYNTCILLALEAFFRILHQMTHFHFFIIASSGINFYPIRLALPIQSYTAIGLFAGTNQQFFCLFFPTIFILFRSIDDNSSKAGGSKNYANVALLSLDRLFSLVAPLYYRQLNQRIYIFCHLLVNAGVSAIYFLQLIPAAKDLPEWPCTGHGADFLTLPNVGPIFWSSCLSMICVSLLSYLLLVILIRLKTEVTTEKQKKIYHSLLLIVLINVFAYFFSLSIHVLRTLSLFPLTLTPLQFWYTNIFTSGLSQNIGAMSIAPILYSNSTDYRNAFKKEFTKLIGLFKTIYYGGQEQSTIIIIFVAFRDPGFHWGLFLPALFFAILAMIGIPLNASLCWVTIKYRSLRHNTCILIALEAFLKILHQLGHFHFLIIALIGINFYPVRLALPIQSYSVIGIIAGCNQSIQSLLPFILPLIQAAKTLPEWPCTGYTSDLFSLPSFGPIFWSSGLVIICAAILAYLFVGIIVRLKTEMSTEKQQKIYHSILLIVLINVATYFFNLSVRTLYTHSLLPLTPLEFWFTNFFTSAFFANIGAMSNAPILYYNSKDYRNAYKKEFKKLIRFFKTICGRQEQAINKIIPISNHITIK